MKAVSFAALASVLVLSACATGTTQPQPAAGNAEKIARNEDSTLTGSRIPARRTEKMVGQIGAQDYKDTKQAAPAPLKGS